MSYLKMYVATQNASPALMKLNRPYQGAGAGATVGPKNVPITNRTKANISNTLVI